MHLTEEE